MYAYYYCDKEVITMEEILFIILGIAIVISTIDIITSIVATVFIIILGIIVILVIGTIISEIFS